MKVCRGMIAGGFAVMLAVVLMVLAAAGSIGWGAAAALLALCVLTQLSLRVANGRWARRALLLWPVLFAVQAVLSFHAYFLTGWDVNTILESAYALAGGDALVDHYYFSLYPNNVFLTLIFAAVIRVLRLLLGNPGLDRCVYVLIVMQCALNTLTGALSARLAKRWTGSDGFALLTAVVYTGFIGISPWLLIPYSDGMALVFPVAILTLYQMQRDGARKGLCWLGIGGLTAAGYLIKPQAAIVTIALLIVEALRLLEQRRPAALAARVLCVAAIVLAAAGPGFDWVAAHSGVNLRPGYKLGPAHFAMMGLSERTGGTYDAQDLALSLSVEDPDERTQMQLGEIARRIQEMGPGGLLSHLARKLRINYGDGTFAWAKEGNFFREMIEDKDDTLSPLLKQIIGCTNGPLYDAMRAYFQNIWQALLLGALGMAAAYAAMRDKPGQRSLALAMMLSLIGLTIFELLFEARARYLYIYAPVYLLLGLCGLRYATQALNARLGKRGGAVR